MRRVRAKYIAHAIVVACCFFSSYLALAGTILTHIIFTFSGLIEIFYSVLTKKIRPFRRLPQRSASQSPAENDSDSNEYLNESAAP
jgi:Ca2+-dependent lipid-binding protein